MSDSIFSPQPVRTSSRDNPRGMPHAARPSAPATTPEPPERLSAPVLVASPATLRTPTTVASSNDAMVIGVLDAPLVPGETARAGFLRKEAELRAAFAQLPVASQRALHARLSNPRAGDQLAERFGRLTADRRTRLLTFLADARRREALAQASR
jgi:hypothetical protein